MTRRHLEDNEIGELLDIMTFSDDDSDLEDAEEMDIDNVEMQDEEPDEIDFVSDSEVDIEMRNAISLEAESDLEGLAGGEMEMENSSPEVAVEYFEENELSELLEPVTQLQEYFTTKDGMLWNKEAPHSSRRRAHNFVNATPGPQNNAKNVNTIREAFLLFVNEDMVNIIVTNTNEFAQTYFSLRNEKNPSNPINWKAVSNDEVYAFISILLAAGKEHGHKQNVTDMWKDDHLFTQPFYRAIMSRERYEQIKRFIRFDDKETRAARIQETGDKLEAIRTIFDSFSKACVENYCPDKYLTIDERLATFRGNCPFRVYIKSKPGRYGIKIWICADAECAYILNPQVYLGMIANRREENQGQRVVMDLVEPYYGSWRGVTADNFFNSIPLAEKLLEKKLTLTGTLRSNKRQIPTEFLPNATRELYSSLFGFTKQMTLTSYVPKKRKAVILISTQHHEADVSNEATNFKPEIILHYNQTKGGVDTGDKMTAEYTCVRSTRRWPFRIFMEIIDMGALNAYIIWCKLNPNWEIKNTSRRRKFLKQLAMELAQPHVENRAHNTKHHQSIKIAMDIFLNRNTSIERHESVNYSESRINAVAGSPVATTKRCAFCSRKEDRKTNRKCSECDKPICSKHFTEKRVFTCRNCKST